MNFNEALLFPIADTLQAPLYLVDGKFHSKKEHTVKAGPWTLKCGSVSQSDELSVARVSFVCRVRKALWAYYICDTNGHRLRCVLFDAAKTPLKADNLSAFCTGNTTTTLTTLKASAVCILEFKDDKWSELDVEIGSLV